MRRPRLHRRHATDTTKAEAMPTTNGSAPRSTPGAMIDVMLPYCRRQLRIEQNQQINDHHPGQFPHVGSTQRDRRKRTATTTRAVRRYRAFTTKRNGFCVPPKACGVADRSGTDDDDYREGTGGQRHTLTADDAEHDARSEHEERARR